MPLSLGISSGAGFLKNPTEAQALGYRVNYVWNPSFEVDTSHWSAVGSATLTRVTSEAQSGSASLEVVVGASAPAVQFGAINNRIPFLAGSGTYYISAYVKLAAGTTSSNYSLRYYEYESNGSSSTVGNGVVNTQSLSVTGDWVRLSGSFTKTTIANYFVIRVATSSTTVGDAFFVDSVMVEKSTTLKTYFDGSNGGFWTGTANDSFSGATPY